MNAILCKPCVMTDAELDIYDIPDLQEDFDLHVDFQEDFATQPVQAIQLAQMPLDEEALHSSFEEAISGRLSTLAINWQQSTVTGSLQHSALSTAIANLAATASESATCIQQRAKNWQRYVTYACLPLMFMLIGFDLMGLLVLHMR
ncbi:MAG: hypothetical protein PVSMB5_35700 [Ktedonobacteraceae bacterium]